MFDNWSSNVLSEPQVCGQNCQKQQDIDSGSEQLLLGILEMKS